MQTHFSYSRPCLDGLHRFRVGRHLYWRGWTRCSRRQFVSHQFARLFGHVYRRCGRRGKRGADLRSGRPAGCRLCGRELARKSGGEFPQPEPGSWRGRVQLRCRWTRPARSRQRVAGLPGHERSWQRHRLHPNRRQRRLRCALRAEDALPRPDRCGGIERPHRHHVGTASRLDLPGEQSLDILPR